MTKGKHHSEATKEKMRIGHLNKKYKPMSEIGRKNISEAQKGRKMSDDWKKRQSERMKGFKHTKETKKKLSLSHLGNKNPMYGKRAWNWKGGYENQLFLNAKRRALKRGAIGSYTLGEWELLKKQYGYKCPACGKGEPEIKLCLDHIIPLSKGGSNYIENIQPLCKPCNSHKYNKLISKYDH